MNRIRWWCNLLQRWWDHGQWRGFSSHMQKACEDHFEYAIGLRDGTIFFFSDAERDEQFLHLGNVIGHNIKPVKYYPTSRGVVHAEAETVFIFERGVQVRLTDIVWVADAPFGS